MQKPHWTPPSSRNACWSGLERALRRQALDGRHLATVGFHGQHETGVDDAAVQAHRARAALPDQAALLGAGQLEVVAKDLEQGVMWGDVQPALATVDGQLDADQRRSCGRHPPPAWPWPSAAPASASTCSIASAVLRAGPHRARRRARRCEEPLEDGRLAPRPRPSRIGQPTTLVDDEVGPRTHAAVGDAGHARVVHRAAERHRGQVMAATAGASDVRGPHAPVPAAAARWPSPAHRGASVVRPEDTKKSSSATRRSPPGPATTSTAP